MLTFSLLLLPSLGQLLAPSGATPLLASAYPLAKPGVLYQTTTISSTKIKHLLKNILYFHKFFQYKRLHVYAYEEIMTFSIKKWILSAVSINAGKNGGSRSIENKMVWRH
jgi:hypothetical protein